jgi:hypothetical protein
MRTRKHYHFASSAVTYRDHITGVVSKNLCLWSRRLKVKPWWRSRTKGTRGYVGIRGSVGFRWRLGNTYLDLDMTFLMDSKHETESYSVGIRSCGNLSEEMLIKANAFAGDFLPNGGFTMPSTSAESDAFCVQKTFSRPVIADELEREGHYNPPHSPQFIGYLINADLEYLKPVVEYLLTEYEE